MQLALESARPSSSLRPLTQSEIDSVVGGEYEYVINSGSYAEAVAGANIMQGGYGGSMWQMCDGTEGGGSYGVFVHWEWDEWEQHEENRFIVVWLDPTK